MRRRGLLLDRDGVINVDRGYVSARDQFSFLPGLFPFLRAAQDRGYRLAIVTNQSGVARGLYTLDDYERLTAWMMESFRREGIGIDLVLACFEHGEGAVPAYSRESFWRKPNPGMILEAARRLRLDLARSAMIGDNARDMQAARAAGVGLCLWLTQDPTASLPDVKTVRDFDQTLSLMA
ncbi:MAG: HAD family hydrolase [Alphaproteobacteria bacterium]|nr:HAD family hydrolase [Alphaproteobacteria bacterium]